MKISVTVTLKKDVLDPQGKVVEQTIKNMGNKNINKVTLYNNDGRLMAFYHFYDNVIDIGAYQHSRKHYIVARVGSAKPLTPLTNRTTPLPLDWSSCYSNI